MKIKKSILFFLCCVLSHFVLAQVISKVGNSPISGAVCPRVPTQYSVTVPNGFAGCTITWTATNGTVTPNGANATVIWNDTPNQTGTLTATFGNCSTQTNSGKTATKSELILSVANQAWGSYGNSVNIDYCTTKDVTVIMPRMFVQGTGGIAQPTLTEVAYDWTIPTGWREIGTNRTGSFGTSVNLIHIEPIKCATPGIVTVKGTLNGVLCTPSDASATATITLNGANPVLTVGPQAGFTGVTSCTTTPVVFTASTSVSLGCVSSYAWTYPASWQFVSQSANTITLRPSGTQADSGPIKSTVTFSCGTTVTSAAYTPPFLPPLIQLPGIICSSGSNAVLKNADVNATVNWTVTPVLTIISGQGTKSVNLKPASPTNNGGATVKATITNCPTAPVVEAYTWGGGPSFSSTTFDGEMVAIICDNYYYTFSAGQHIYSAVPMGTTSLPTFSIQTSSPYVQGVPNGTNYNISVHPKHTDFEFIVKTTATNTCGTKEICTYFTNFASLMAASTYPNPSNNVIHVEAGQEGEQKRISLINSNMKVAYSVETTEAEIDVATAALEEGVYVLKIDTGRKSTTKKIQVKH